MTVKIDPLLACTIKRAALKKYAADQGFDLESNYFVKNLERHCQPIQDPTCKDTTIIFTGQKKE